MPSLYYTCLTQVGAQTETELKEKKLRVEDALNATKAAVEEGVVIGGGCTLLRLSMKVDEFKATLTNQEQQVGLACGWTPRVATVRRACQQTMRACGAAAHVPGMQTLLTCMRTTGPCVCQSLSLAHTSEPHLFFYHARQMQRCVLFSCCRWAPTLSSAR